MLQFAYFLSYLTFQFNVRGELKLICEFEVFL